VSETASPVRRSRRGRLARIAAALAVLLAVAGYVVVQVVIGGRPPRCTVSATDSSESGADGEGGTYEMSPEQAANAATISAVGTTRDMPERAVTIALATALQESALRNLRHGDRDSLGLFQQRPSKGWGTADQIVDPVYAAGQFYEHLSEVPGYSRLPLTVAAQRVQRSAFPQAYAKHEPDATLLAAAFTGRAAAVLTCPAPKGTAAGDPAKVRAELVRAFGPGVLSGGRVPDGAGAPHAAEISVPVVAMPGAAGGSHGEMVDGNPAQRGWELAHWAVAQASVLRIDRVAYAGRVWSARDADEGWQRADGGAKAADSADVRIHTAQ
jgi:hypothetical protein